MTETQAWRSSSQTQRGQITCDVSVYEEYTGRGALHHIHRGRITSVMYQSEENTGRGALHHKHRG